MEESLTAEEVKQGILSASTWRGVIAFFHMMRPSPPISGPLIQRFVLAFLFSRRV